MKCYSPFNSIMVPFAMERVHTYCEIGDLSEDILNRFVQMDYQELFQGSFIHILKLMQGMMLEYYFLGNTNQRMQIMRLTLENGEDMSGYRDETW